MSKDDKPKVEIERHFYPMMPGTAGIAGATGATGATGPPGDSSVLRVTLLITSSAVVSLIVSLLTGTMNIGGYVKQINVNTELVKQLTAESQVVMLAEAQESTLVTAMTKTIEKLSNDRDVNFGTIKAIAERLATLEAQVRSESKQIDDMQTDYVQHRKTEEEVLRSITSRLDDR